DCGLQLPAEAIGRFRHDLDWRRADAQQHANALMREMLVDYVAAYQKGSTGASMHYADRPAPLDVGREFASLAQSDFCEWQPVSALRRHLVEYPGAGAPGVTDLLYWSKEKVGRRTVASVTHLAISRTPPGSPAEYAIASKHLYGTHYFDASLGLTVLLRDRSSSEPATYLVYVNRSRIDMFDGVFGGMIRK